MNKTRGGGGGGGAWDNRRSNNSYPPRDMGGPGPMRGPDPYAMQTPVGGSIGGGGGYDNGGGGVAQYGGAPTHHGGGGGGYGAPAAGGYSSQPQGMFGATFSISLSLSTLLEMKYMYMMTVHDGSPLTISLLVSTTS